MNDMLKATLISSVRMSPEQFLKAKQANPSINLRAKIIPPSLDDDDDYGCLEVEMKSLRYEVEL